MFVNNIIVKLKTLRQGLQTQIYHILEEKKN